MGVQTTVVFADLFGSTGVFESVGNARATEAVTQATAWIAAKITKNGGRVVKYLGDGVLSIFGSSADALVTVVDIQRSYQLRLERQEPALYMPLRIGVGRGDVEFVDGDCYGDAVNIAARLSELTGPHQIWINDQALDQNVHIDHVHFRSLGPIALRGRAEPCTIYQIEWQEEVNSDYFTVQASLSPEQDMPGADVLGGQVELSWGGATKSFHAFDMPILLGRARHLNFVINDPRVSRTHARVEWHNGSMVLVDISSYGCSVRFAGGGADVVLRRDECVLHGHGDIALGTSFNDPAAIIVGFSIS
ncbi:FHA domain-containing protein [Candidatus Symbiobacter mobilis]|uniref:Adenylate cyclase n=1 Tax=Candidatus Symbiobacter mobilis CR TaxID=946483 RepID=U5N5Y8_9BURK|nr:FHA domain-containing protein [Candidatus Symbiobacter mobilis]AGX86782.1 adenylate cyclase [Candidatus Symbiobacter mobilis CR]